MKWPLCIDLSVQFYMIFDFLVPVIWDQRQSVLRTSIADLPMHVSGSITITYHMSKEILRQVINLLDDSSIGLNKHILMLYPFKWNFQIGVFYCFDTSYQLSNWNMNEAVVAA